MSGFAVLVVHDQPLLDDICVTVDGFLDNAAEVAAEEGGRSGQCC